jgi:hypothetical protein
MVPQWSATRKVTSTYNIVTSLCCLVVRASGYRTEMYCFLWGKNWICICYVEESRPPLRSSGQSSWLQNGDVLWFLWGSNWIYICYVEEIDRLCGLVVRVPGYRSIGPRSIPGAITFSEKCWVWKGVHSASWVQLRSYLKEKVAASV